jgi:hypothetical protein
VYSSQARWFGWEVVVIALVYIWVERRFENKQAQVDTPTAQQEQKQ